MKLKLFLLLMFLQIIYSYSDNNTEFIQCVSGIKSCSNRGLCSLDNTHCECFEPYASFECVEDDQCCYRRRNQSTAMFLHFLFGLIGGSMFYLRHMIHGTLLLLLSTGMFCVAPLIATFYDEGNTRPVFKKIYYCCIFLGLVYWTVLTIFLSGCDFTDENDIKMYCNF